jgi:chromosome segregation ATPase
LRQSRGDDSRHFEEALRNVQEEKRVLQEDNSVLREEVNKLRFAVGVQVERGKDKRKLFQSAVKALEEKLASTETALRMQGGKVGSYEKSTFLLSSRIARVEAQTDQAKETKAQHLAIIDQLSKENARLARLLAAQQDALKDKCQLMDCLQQEIGDLAESFQGNAAREKSQCSVEVAEHRMHVAALESKCNLLEKQLEQKERQNISQSSLLKTLDSSLDRMIAK